MFNILNIVLIAIFSFFVTKIFLDNDKLFNKGNVFKYRGIYLLNLVLHLLLLNITNDLFEFIMYSIFLTASLFISYIDKEIKLIPNELVIITLICGVLLSISRAIANNSFMPIMYMVINLLIGFMIIFLLIVISRGGMGLGDAKYLAVIAVLLGYEKAILVLFISSFAGTFYAIYLLATKKGKLKSEIPFGPFLTMGTYCMIFFENFVYKIFFM
ncbi:MAG: A24 family peptidase [Clostridia bacterium]|jgi:prepilin signal peptidase PulO-like enzyme (type II secretory pathway)|nr:A24 family peptidase [Clostridia bacterium]